MPNLRDVRRRIKSIRSMSKLTRAMNMVALSKMKKAQYAAAFGIPYADMLNEILIKVTAGADVYHHALMEKRATNRKLVVVVSSDRGLCGALNTNLFRECAKYDPDNTFFIAVGARASQFLQKSGKNFIVDFSYGDTPALSEARMICRFITQFFLDDEIDSADIIFSYFVSTFRQIPFTWKLLPVGLFHEEFEQMPESVRRTRPSLSAETSSLKNINKFDFEPDANSVYESLLLRSLDYQLLQIMREVRASEHSARMVSMKQATDNADEIMEKLELSHNNLRQASITKELLEISSASA
jgi:F-type H+-transporting ATPase subunit gamma